MNNMDIDSPPERSNLRPLDRIIGRLALLGVPGKYLGMLQEGIVAFAIGNPSHIPELVTAILPADEEVMEVLQEAKATPKKTLVGPTMKNIFRESMIWLQWLMFEGEPLKVLKDLSKMSAGRGVCGAVWGNNDIAYRCRTCENDPTCAICVPCFQNGNHKDHDYSIIYTSGGCCDCGDVTAWKHEGFCSKHKGTEVIKPLPEELASSVGPVFDVLLACWKEKLISAENSTASDRDVMYKYANEVTFAMVEMLLEFCKYSESLLSFISKRVISSAGLLDILVRAERFLSETVVRKLHELLLKLLGEPIFKYEFAKVFLIYYPFIVNEAIKENSDDVLKKYPLLSTLSVQIFTVPTLTPRLVKEMNLLGILLESLASIFVSCTGKDGHLQVSKWGNLYVATIRVVEDIRFVMSHSVVPQYVIHMQRDVLRTWMGILAFVQGMNPLKRETGLHIEEENEHANLPFGLSHSIGNIHSLLVDGAFSEVISEETVDVLFGSCEPDKDDGDRLRHAKVGRLSQESSVCSASGRISSLASGSMVTAFEANSFFHCLVPSSVTWLTFECLRAIENWLGVENTSGSLSNVSPNSRSVSGGNFIALKKTLSNIRKGESIFGRFTSLGDGNSRQNFLPRLGSLQTNVETENLRSIKCGESDSVVRGSAGSDDSAMEGDCAAREVDALHVLSFSKWPYVIYDVSSQDVSIHIPLHRFLSMLLQRALRRCYGESTMPDISSACSTNQSSAVYGDFFKHMLGGCHPYGFSAFTMEHLLRNRVFCAQLHAGMWRKNGDVAIRSCEWYRSVRWSEQGLELDLFLLQSCAALAPVDLFVSRIVERFGLSDSYLSLNVEQSSEYEPVLVQEMLTLIIQIVQERRFSGLTKAENVKRELIHKLAIGDATRSQLVKSLPRDLSKFEKLQEILDTVAVYSNPSGFNQGMYSLRLAYWKELDLYHPRWNSRDLQIAEERYIRFCSISPLTTQLPSWTKIFPPLKGVARVATCKTVFKIIRAVLFYAVLSDKSSEMRAPDGVLLVALHLLSLALDICIQQRVSIEESCYIQDSAPIIALACEETCEGLNSCNGDQCLLSLLVSLMRMHKKENISNLLEAGNCDLSALVESLLKKFAEIDTGCLTKLQQLAPEIDIHLSKTALNEEKAKLASASDSEKWKARARERQAAILEKMRAEQSKFLSSINSSEDDGSTSETEASNSHVGQDLENSGQDVCSLCHNTNSRSPLSFLVLLQKSRLLSFVDRGPPSWDQVFHSDKEHIVETTNRMSDQKTISRIPDNSGTNFLLSELGMISSTQLAQLVENSINEFSSYGHPEEVIAILEYVKAVFPTNVGNIQVPCLSNDGRDRGVNTLDTLEQDIYVSIRRNMCDTMLTETLPVAEGGGLGVSKNADSALVGKYVAALSGAMTEYPSASENAQNDVVPVEFTSEVSAYSGFGPVDCDGILVSSCGHAVHQGCLDRYMSSLRERHVRRIVFEGGHIVDPDQGEFLCPVCRQLANSVLPALPGDFHEILKQPTLSTVNSSCVLGSSATSVEENETLLLRQALSLLQSAATVVGQGEILKAFPQQKSEKMKPNIKHVSRLLTKMYFQNKQDKFSGSSRVSHSMILWDTLKSSLICLEIAARCGRTSLSPAYGIDSLHKELKYCSGFVFSLLLRIVQRLRSQNSLHVLQRFRGIQLFADSICSGILRDYPNHKFGRGGSMLSILKYSEDVLFPDVQFWDRASEPILAQDPFSSLMWVIFCLPFPFISCEDSLLTLVHMFYAVSVAQAIITYCARYPDKISAQVFHDCLIADISKALGESTWVQQYFYSNYIDSGYDVGNTIRKLSFPFLRRCALLWKLLKSFASAPFCEGDYAADGFYHDSSDKTESAAGELVELNKIKELEKMFKVPPLNAVLKDEMLRSLVKKWLNHLRSECEDYGFQFVLHCTPAVPFKLMRLPHIYQDLLERYVKQLCSDCKSVLDEPALCLLCGRLCSPNSKPCCRKNGCKTHAMSCGAGTGVFLLIRRTTILLLRCARQSPWPSPYLDAFGEEDIGMQRGKPLYLNEERYTALTHMVASHGLDQSSEVLGQTTIGTFFLI
ncbi:E3 ubiquitin-protein ligase PRT6-like [Tripterygium wilfordii]|uniref:E3 ubiquitin-protein ligase PRT6-like n=1 Tax=Tripterygium wilfordii TaxID=458696 RepID=UPI0018F8055D|nr:E3 ubiquitin-protein ligase PRT6-like [Tripterygium wilfordii]XP_038696655.1 E3 ubiquitin-protein ligase PRT6-like [Tripterygium wilfordii]XP_038696661.1 E3 ubiquitin-protein ligase PRT6-like [Tripterygium wilfordii]XP_038696669.1 E3 ubiquitin-protein ligase PRT6-like [Tripterygium wilfordii]